jgi:hypothetical protein
MFCKCASKSVSCFWQQLILELEKFTCIMECRKLYIACRTSVPVPSLSRSVLSYGAFLGVSGNLRYQLVYGADQLMQQSLNNIGLVIFCSTALRSVPFLKS